MKRIQSILLACLTVFLAACEKDTEAVHFAPSVNTGNATDIYRKGATLAGTIDMAGNASAESYGILFSRMKSMTEYTEYPITSGETDYKVKVKNLEQGSTYYYCAYAYSGYSMVLGEVKNFTTTENNPPVFDGLTMDSIGADRVMLSTEILDDGGTDILLSGFCWKEGNSGVATFIDNVVNVTEVTDNKLEVTITGLKPESDYVFSAYSINSHGMGFSESKVVKTDKMDATLAYLAGGTTFNERIKQFVNGNSMTFAETDSLINKIEFVVESNMQVENFIEVSAENSPAPIYATFHAGEGLLTVYTSAKNIEIVNAGNLFCALGKLHNIDFGNFKINATTTNLNMMFMGCYSLTSIDVSNWDTSNVIEMQDMFALCSSLTTLDVSNWDTSNVIEMQDMFQKCSSLTTLDVSNWDTSNVIEMQGMFSGCSSLTTLDVSKWDTSNVTDMYLLFYSCSSLTDLDVSNWNTSKVTNMGDVFNGCSSLKTLDVSNWNMSNVENMSGMFANTLLTSVDVSTWDVSKVYSMVSMFYNCPSLSSLDVSNWNTSNVFSLSYMFVDCSSLTSLDVSNWNTSGVENMTAMFAGCSSLTSLDVSNWDTSNVTDMRAMFKQCSSFTSLNMYNWNTANVIDMNEMFMLCSSLTSLNISNWILKSDVKLDYMFADCSTTSQACEITSTQATQDFLLSKTDITRMNTDYFTWVNPE